MSKRDEFQKSMEEHLELWTARFEALASKVDAKIHTEHAKQLEEWKTASRVASAKLAELKATTGDAWDVIKVEMEKVWTVISSGLDQAESAKRASEDNAKAATSSVAVHSIPVVATPDEQPKTA
jgi:CRISPR/Cas system-associated exonuclease Cas4 (RecB family)